MAGSLTSVAQYSSSDLRDAAACGPYPLYVYAGYTNTFQNQNLKEMSQEFMAQFGKGDAAKKLHGIQLGFGGSLIQEDSRFSYSIEGKYMYLQNQVPAGENYFNMVTNQAALTFGMRWVALPQFLGVLHVQAGPILYSSTKYDFSIDDKLSTVRIHSSPSTFGHEWQFLARLSLMDPAGTEGGWGLFVELGYNLRVNDPGNTFTDAVHEFNPSYDKTTKIKTDYLYISYGITLPLALRIK